MWGVKARFRRVAVVLGASLLGMLALAGAASAAAFTVNSTADVALPSPTSNTCPATCTLREAVQAADNTGGANTIKLPAGTYKLTIPSTATDDPSTGDLDIYNTNGSTGGVALSITGAGASSTILDANHLDRYFAIDSPADSLSVSGVTVENGSQNDATPSANSSSSGNGGAVYNDGSLSIDQSVLTNNSAYGYGGAVDADTGAISTSITHSSVTQNSEQNNDGGAVSALSGTLTLTGDTFTGNVSYNYGGAIYADEQGNTLGAFNISSTVMSGNAADDPGGAMYLSNTGPITVASSEFSNNNSSDDAGGAIAATDTGRLTVSNSTFSNDNAGNDDGGAIYASSTDLSISNSAFTGDVADNGAGVYVDGTTSTAQQTITGSTFGYDTGGDDGGAIYDNSGDLAITNTTMDHDSEYKGGGIYYDSGDGLSMTNDTLDSNQASQYGGGIFFATSPSTGSIDLVNDTIARNTSYYGGGIAYPEEANSIENTIVADNSGQWTAGGRGDCYYDSPTDNAGAADQGGNLDSDGSCFALGSDQVAKDPRLGALAYNGGPLAGAPGEQVGLQTDALQAGSPAIGNAIAADCPATDERGVARSSVQGKCDIGAFQTAPAALSLSKSAPSSATVGAAFKYTITVSDHGPGPSTTTTVVDQLPAHTTLYGADPSAGSCSSSGSPAKVTCDLGVLSNGASAKVALLVSVSTAGQVTNTARASNDQGASAHASATTKITPAKATGTHPTAKTANASDISQHAAKLTGQVSTGGQPTSYFFQYGTSTSYGATTALARITSSETVSQMITGLSAGHKYHYRLVAVNDSGTSYGADRTFTTKGKTEDKK